MSQADCHSPMKIVALVPMREHSERVPGKNYRPFAGRPLYHHIISSLLACPYVDSIYINTDSDFIMEDAPRHFNVHLIERPKHLRSDLTPMNDILLYDVTQVSADYYLQTHRPLPLLSKPFLVHQSMIPCFQSRVCSDASGTLGEKR